MTSSTILFPERRPWLLVIEEEPLKEAMSHFSVFFVNLRRKGGVRGTYNCSAFMRFFHPLTKGQEVLLRPGREGAAGKGRAGGGLIRIAG